jgi:hypothetical protein
MLDFESPPAPAVRSIQKADLPGIIVDDSEAQLTGFDSQGHTTPGFIGSGYRHDGGVGDGQQKARFIPALPVKGRYQVSIAYSALANRASNVPVTIHHAEGDSQVIVDQKQKPKGQNNLHWLGTFTFSAGTSNWVEMSNNNTDGHVIIDAVQFLEVR